jgi:hypothetical protein
MTTRRALETDPDTGWHISRRQVLALGLAAAGAGVFGRPALGHAQQPTPTDWDLATLGGTTLETLGKMILFDKSPYATGTLLNSRKYAASNFWQLYLQRDDGGATWTFRRQTVYVERVVRIPYFVTEANVETLDHLVIGYTEPVRKVPAPSSSEAWIPVQNGTFQNDYQRLGKLLMYDLNKSFGSSATPKVAPAATGWETRVMADTKVRWTFRDQALRIEKALAIPYRVDDEGWQRSLLLVGYEGSGGY